MPFDHQQHEREQKRRKEQEERKLPLFILQEQASYNEALMKAQNKFNEQLLDKFIQSQSKSTWFTIGAMIIGAIIGASASIATVLLSPASQTKPLTTNISTDGMTPPVIIEQIDSALKNASSPNPPIQPTANTAADFYRYMLKPKTNLLKYH